MPFYLISQGKIAGNPKDVVESIKKIFSSYDEAKDILNYFENLEKLVSISNVSEIVFDMSIIRGLAYYTGIVFEAQLLDAPSFGSVGGGGRYDNLVENFGSVNMPAVGMSVGLDRLIAALSSLDFSLPNASVKIITLLQEEVALPYAFSVSNSARDYGYVSEMYTGNKKKLGEQFQYAESLGYDFAFIVGSNEAESNTLCIKNLKTKEQVIIKREELGSYSFS